MSRRPSRGSTATDAAKLTETLLDATLAEFDDDEDVAVYTHTEDVDLVEELVEDRNAVVDGEIDCLGGVVAESDTSRVRVNNTFDSIRSPSGTTS